MLGFIEGRIVSKNEDTQQCIVLAGQVGYEVTVPKPMLERLLPETTTALWIHTHVREDLLTLYGFAGEPEKQFFRVLLGVSGLGPKTALSLLGEHGASRLVQLILHKEIDAISEAPGVGKKLAQKLVLELSGKIEKLAWLDRLPKSAATSDAPRPVAASPRMQLWDDLSSALANLGYDPKQVKGALDRLFDREETSQMEFAAVLRSALQEMSGRQPHG